METKKRGFYRMIKHTIDTGSFRERIVAYIFLSVPLLFFLIAPLSLLISSYIHFEILKLNSYNIDSITLICIIVPLLLVILFLEFRTRNFRRKNGLPIYKNIEEDLIQMEIEQQIAREQKAYNKVTGSTDKNDINYWYDLFQKRCNHQRRVRG